MQDQDGTGGRREEGERKGEEGRKRGKRTKGAEVGDGTSFKGSRRGGRAWERRSMFQSEGSSDSLISSMQGSSDPSYSPAPHHTP